MNIHDELSFELFDGEDKHIVNLHKISEDFKTPLPIVADLEQTFTNWKEKKAVDVKDFITPRTT